MSTSTSVEELLTETLKRAGELAIPDDLHLPFRLDDRDGKFDDPPLPRARGHSARAWWITVSGIAALILVAVGLTVVLHSSPSITIERTQLSAAQGQRLLCGAPGCVPMFHAAAGQPKPSGVQPSGTAFGANQAASTAVPYETWILATDGRLVRVINESTRAVKSVERSRSGTVYLSAGDGRYYRFTTPGHGPLRVIGQSVNTVTLKGTDGKTYVLDLRTSTLLPRS